MDEWASKHTALRLANKKLFSSQLQTLRIMPGTYKSGFRQAYVDIANGGDGATPPVAPAKYWNTQYRSEHGQELVAYWFDGYRDGAASALVELDAMRQVGSSTDWQFSNRDCNSGCQIGSTQSRFGINAGRTGSSQTAGMSPSGCATGNCPSCAPTEQSMPQMQMPFGQIPSNYSGDVSFSPAPYWESNQFNSAPLMYAPQPAPVFGPPQSQFAPQPQFAPLIPQMAPQPIPQPLAPQPSMGLPPHAPVFGAPPAAQPQGQPHTLQSPSLPNNGLQPGYSSGPVAASALQPSSRPITPTAPNQVPLPNLSPGYSSGRSQTSPLPQEPVAY